MLKKTIIASTSMLGAMLLAGHVQAAQMHYNCKTLCDMGCMAIYNKSAKHCHIIGTTFNKNVDENGVINGRCTCNNGMVENIRMTFTHFNTDDRKNH